MEREEELEFDEFFASAYPVIVRSAMVVVGDREVAREITQDAFVKALVHWRRVRTYDYAEAWVRKVAFRMALRAKRREPERAAMVDREVVDPLADLDLHDAISRLSRMQRAAVALHYLDDLPIEQVADVLSCKPSTARVHLYRARERLAEYLHEERDDAAR